MEKMHLQEIFGKRALKPEECKRYICSSHQILCDRVSVDYGLGATMRRKRVRELQRKIESSLKDL